MLGVKQTWLFRLELATSPLLLNLSGALCISVGTGFGLGSLAPLVGWRYLPSHADFFWALATVGAALLVAFAVVAADTYPRIHRAAANAASNDTQLAGELRDAITLPIRSVGVALGALVGIGTCLALSEAPLHQSHWWLMALMGVSIGTIGWLGVQIAIGIYVGTWATLLERPGPFDVGDSSASGPPSGSAED